MNMHIPGTPPDLKRKAEFLRKRIEEEFEANSVKDVLKTIDNVIDGLENDSISTDDAVEVLVELTGEFMYQIFGEEEMVKRLDRAAASVQKKVM